MTFVRHTAYPDIGEGYIYFCILGPHHPHHHSLTVEMPIPLQRLRLLVLQLQLHEAEEHHEAILLTLICERQRQQGPRPRRWWVRPWIERRRMFGQFDTLFKELERESHGDYMSYIRMDPTTFGELLLRITPRITKGPRCVFVNY